MHKYKSKKSLIHLYKLSLGWFLNCHQVPLQEFLKIQEVPEIPPLSFLVAVVNFHSGLSIYISSRDGYIERCYFPEGQVKKNQERRKNFSETEIPFPRFFGWKFYNWKVPNKFRRIQEINLFRVERFIIYLYSGEFSGRVGHFKSSKKYRRLRGHFLSADFCSGEIFGLIWNFGFLLIWRSKFHFYY